MQNQGFEKKNNRACIPVNFCIEQHFPIIRRVSTTHESEHPVMHGKFFLYVSIFVHIWILNLIFYSMKLQHTRC